MTLVYQPAGRIPTSNQENYLDDVSLYWRRLQLLSVFQEPGHVSSVDFCPVDPPMIATTSSVRLSIFDAVVCEPVNLFSRFKKAVHGVRFRADGKLLILGGDEGKLRVFDFEHNTGLGKAPLRSIRVSDNIVRVTDFTQSGKILVSMADDGIIKLWDLANTVSKPIQEFAAHKDFIRTGLLSSVNEHIMVSGGYDHKIKLWDARCQAADGASVEIDVGQPVEKLVFFPGENLIASASGNAVKVWDLTSGGRMLTNLQHHHKTVTSLSMASNAFISAGVDKRINFYNLSTLSLSYSTSVAAPVYSLAVSKDNQRMAIGMGNLLSVHMKASKTYTETTSNTAAPADKLGFPVKPSKKADKKGTVEPKLCRVDHLMKAYRHGEVINVIFSKNFYMNTQYEQVAGWLRQLIHRNVITSAISGHSTQIQLNILKFLNKYMMKNNYFGILSVVAQAFFEVYAKEDVEQRVLDAMHKINDLLTKELMLQSSICQTVGALELILNNSKKAQVSKTNNALNIFDEPVFKSVRI